MKIQEINEKSMEFVREYLYSGVISDILDDLKLTKQVMHHSIRPIFHNAIVFGKVLTMLGIDDSNLKENPYELELKAIDQLKPFQIVVAGTGNSTKSGFWGELLTNIAIKNNCNGAVIDTFTRDTKKIIELNYNLFCTGRCPRDSKNRTRVIDFNCKIECGDVLVNPGDLIFGDLDGIVVIPEEYHLEVLNKSYEKVEAENIVRKDILKGISAEDVYDKYGVL